MHPKRQREIALAIAAILLIAVAVWTDAARHGAARGSGASAARRSKQHAAAVEAPHRRDRSRGARSQAAGARGERQKSISVQAEACTAAAAAGRQTTTGAGRRRRAGSGGPSEPPPPPRIPLKYIGDMADPKNAGKRIAILSDARGVVLRPRRRHHRRPLSDREDRRRINRACVSRRARAPNHQTNRTIKRE